jgi:membrane associated rhomboid family serine protease
MTYQSYRPGGFKLLPDAVKNLLIINGILFLTLMVFGDKFNLDLNDILGLHYFQAEEFRPYQLITYMFMHGNFMHIFFNMFALWMFGSAMENFWGTKRFLIYYMVTGIGAALTQYAVLYYQLTPVLDSLDAFLMQPELAAFQEMIANGTISIVSPEMQVNFQEFSVKYDRLMLQDPSLTLPAVVDFVQQYRIDYLNAPVVVGASGAVFGLLLAYGMMFPNNIIYIYFAIPLKAKYFVIIYGALELYSGLSNNSADNVAHFAHLGGMLFGIFLILYWRRNRKTFY